MKRYFLIILLAFLCFVSCRRAPVTINNWEGGLIKKLGTYTTKDNKLTIIVSQEPKGILKYVVQTSENAALIKSDESASVYQRWSLYWDTSTEYLWFDSNGIGNFVWIKQDDGSYIKHRIFDPRYIKIIPKPFYMSLSSLDQKVFKNQGYNP